MTTEVPKSFLVDRSCPTCGCAAHLTRVQSVPSAESLDFEELKKGWYGFFRSKVFFSFVRCDRCHQLYNPVYLNDHALLELYRDMPDNGAGLPERHLTATQNGYFAFLKQYGKLSGEVLELGPDIGLFSQFFAKEINVSSIWLFEPNVSVHRQLAAKLAGKQCHIETNIAQLEKIADESLECCVLVHVLDHLPDPSLVLGQLVKKLRPKGRVLIVTHDESSLLARMLGPRWPAYCLQHPQLYDRETTATLLESNGLKVLRTAKSVNYFTIGYLIKHLAFAFGIESSKRWNLSGPVVPLRLGNIMTVAVRR